jgi:hypothetical protein
MPGRGKTMERDKRQSSDVIRLKSEIMFRHKAVGEFRHVFIQIYVIAESKDNAMSGGGGGGGRECVRNDVKLEARKLFSHSTQDEFMQQPHESS